MAHLTPEQVAEKHARRLKGAVQDIQNGVNNVSVAPGKQAAAKAQKMKTNLVAAIDSGKWANRVGAVSLEDWKSKMLNKGVNRIAQGVDDAQGKITAFYAELLPFQAGIQSKIAAMPDLTLEDNLARMTTNAREMAKFKRRG